MKLVRVQAHAIDVADQFTLVDAQGYGASASFIGRVRGDNGLTELYLEHHPIMTVAALEQLAQAAATRWDLDDIRLIHRVGSMGPGDTIVAIITSSAHRAEALAACEFLIDRLKTDVPLWKREAFADGSGGWVAERATDLARADRWTSLDN